MYSVKIVFNSYFLCNDNEGELIYQISELIILVVFKSWF